MPSPLAAAAKAFRNPEKEVRERRFPVASRGLTIQRQKEAMKRRDAKLLRGLIRPENADAILEPLPLGHDGDRIHAIICGDFVYMDLILRMISKLGAPEAITLTPLSISAGNISALVGLLQRFPACPLRLVLSQYFQSTSKEIFVQLETQLAEAFPDRFRLSIGRCHAKIALLDFGPEVGRYVVEGSANLRSAKSIENLAIFRDPDLYALHAEWIEEFHASTLAEHA